MALTKIYEPDKSSPVNDQLVVVWSSNSSSDDDFRYEYTITNGDTNVDLVSVKPWPDVSRNNYGIYNMNMILKDYLSMSLNWNNDSIVSNTGNTIRYDYTVTEYVGTTSGATTTVTDLFTFLGATDYSQSFDYNDYIIYNGSSNSKFLSNWDGDRTYKLTEYGVINAFNSNFVALSPSWSRLVIKVYHISGGSTSYYITNGNATYDIVSAPIGPKNINDAVDNNVVYSVSGDVLQSSNIINTDTDYYEIWASNTGSVTKYSEILTINLDQECNKFDGTEFMWLGKLSNNETFTFRFANIKTFNNKREEIKKDYHGLDDSNNWTYIKGDRGRQTISVKTTESHTAISGWLDDTISSNLMELYSSSNVYIIIDDELYPIIITDTKVVEKTKQNNRLFNHTISYEMAYDINNNL